MKLRKAISYLVMIKSISLILVVLLLVACGSSPPINQLKIQFYDVRNIDYGLTGMSFSVFFRVENPTDRKITSPVGKIDVFINEEKMGSSGLSIDTLEPWESTRVESTMFVDYNNIGKTTHDVIMTENFKLNLKGFLESEGQKKEFTSTVSYP